MPTRSVDYAVTLSQDGYPLTEVEPPATIAHPALTEDYLEGFSMGYYEGAIEAILNIVNGSVSSTPSRIDDFTAFLQNSFGAEV